MKMKIGKLAFIVALVVAILNIAAASVFFLNNLSVYTYTLPILLGSFTIFPICLFVIFSYLLNRIKWLDKKAFLWTFSLCYLALFSFPFLAFMFGSGWGSNFFGHLAEPLASVLLFFGFIIGKPLSFILGWPSNDSKLLSMIVGAFVFPATLALIYSRASLLAKQGEKLYRAIFIFLLFLLLLLSFLFAFSEMHVRDLIEDGECTYGLNILECSNYEDLGAGYFAIKEDVYHGYSPTQLEGESIDEFEVFEGNNEGFALGRDSVYYKGKLLPISNVDRWRILNNMQYQDGLNNYSADNRNVFFQLQLLSNAYPENTVVFGENYACNNEFVYYQGNIIEGADVDSFVETECSGITRDRESYYYSGYWRDGVNYYAGNYYEDGSSWCYDLVKGSCLEARGE